MLHRDYMKECWADCVELAESVIAHKSNDLDDEDARRVLVFNLAENLFTKHALDFADFIELAKPRRVRK